jgi:type I restriction enzyme, R subunit
VSSLKREFKAEFTSLNDFIRKWNGADQKRAIIDEIEQRGVKFEALAAEVGKDLDPFDLILHVAFGQKPLTRKERAEKVRKRNYFAKYGGIARAVLESLLQKYADEGVTNIDETNVLRIPPLTSLGTPFQLIKAFGGKDEFVKAVREMQSALYADAV